MPQPRQQKKELILAYGSREIGVHYGKEMWQQATRLGMGAGDERLHLQGKQEAEREVKVAQDFQPQPQPPPQLHTPSSKARPT